VGVQRRGTARDHHHPRGGDAQPVQAGERGDDGGAQGDLEGFQRRAGAAESAVVEVVGGHVLRGLARVPARRGAGG